MIKISVIVAVYQVERFIRKCLNSLQNKTFSDFEVLLIDDGSKDLSGIICDEYAAQDSRFRVIHKKNGGVSSARQEEENYGDKTLCFMGADGVIYDRCVPGVWCA